MSCFIISQSVKVLLFRDFTCTLTKSLFLDYFPLYFSLHTALFRIIPALYFINDAAYCQGDSNTQREKRRERTCPKREI